MTSRRTYFQRALAITEPAVQPAETLLTENAGQKGLDFERRVSELSAEVSALKVHILFFDALKTTSSRDDREQLAMESLQLKQQQIRDTIRVSYSVVHRSRKREGIHMTSSLSTAAFTNVPAPSLRLSLICS